MHLVTGQARHRGLSAELRFPELPRPLRVHRGDQVPDSALELHRMTAQAIVDQKRALVKDITAAVVKHAEVPADAVTVIIHENPRTDKAKGGVLFSER